MFEDFDELFGGGDGVVELDDVVLIEDGAAGGLEEDVGEWVSGGAFLFDLGVDVIAKIFRLPDAVLESEFVNEGTVGAKGLLAGAFERELFDQVPFIGRGALLEEISEGGARVALSGVPDFKNWSRAA